MNYKKVQDEKKKELALFYNKRIRSMEEVFNVSILKIKDHFRKLKMKR